MKKIQKTGFWKYFLWTAMLVLVIIAASTVVVAVDTDGFAQFGGSLKGERLERMKSSPHFDGKNFINSVPTRVTANMKQYSDMFWRYMTGKEVREPKEEIEVSPVERGRFAGDSPPMDGLRITWLGHSTALIEIDGYRVLTDPVWAERASPLSFFGPKRFHRPPLALDDLPKLDAVIISHDHYDHLDKDAVLRLNADGVHLYVPLGVGAHLEKWGINAEGFTEMDWWDVAEVPKVGKGLKLVATPARHFSGRGLTGWNTTLWASWAIVGPKNRVFFSGDSGPFPGFVEIGERFGPFDATLIKVGAYDRSWPDIHLNPEQAIDAHVALRGGLFIPIHWGTFNLAIHDWTEPANRVAAIADEGDLRVAIPRPGETVDTALPQQITKWWMGEGKPGLAAL